MIRLEPPVSSMLFSSTSRSLTLVTYAQVLRIRMPKSLAGGIILYITVRIQKVALAYEPDQLWEAQSKYTMSSKFNCSKGEKPEYIARRCVDFCLHSLDPMGSQRFDDYIYLIITLLAIFLAHSVSYFVETSDLWHCVHSCLVESQLSIQRPSTYRSSSKVIVFVTPFSAVICSVILSPMFFPKFKILFYVFLSIICLLSVMICFLCPVVVCVHAWVPCCAVSSFTASIVPSTALYLQHLIQCLIEISMQCVLVVYQCADQKTSICLICHSTVIY